MVFTEKNRKKNRLLFFLILPLFCGGVFLTQTPTAEAWAPLVIAGAKIAGVVGLSLLGVESIGTVFHTLLYGIFTMFGMFASLALTIFEWAIKPESIQVLMNNPGVYESWKFIRDFFNLFFILILLYTAFSVIFQIEKNFKKTLLSLVLAALFINFSFPISRALIDMTNVPMYFFANQMMAREGGNTDLFGQTLSASGLEHILLPEKAESDISRLLMGIVFLFIFSITLLVLSVMFVIRLVVLVVLVMFSSVGFAASVIPKLDTYGKMWWENFWKYAFFGPAAMLMLLMSVRVFASLGAGTSGTSSKLIQGMHTVAGTTSIEPSFFQSMLLFTIPIIMLWVAMGLAQKMSIAGAGSVVGQGQKFVKWVGKKTLDGGKWVARKPFDNAYTRGAASGLQERLENTKGLKWLSPKTWDDASKKKQEQVQGYASGGADGRDRVIENQHNKKVSEEEKKMEEIRTSETQLRAVMADRTGKYSKAEQEAAVRLLSKKDALQNGQDMADAIATMDRANAGNTGAQEEKRRELIKKAGGEIYENGTELATVIQALGNDTKAITALIDKASKNALRTINSATYGTLATNPNIKGKLDGKLRKEGQSQVIVEYEVASGLKTSAQSVNDLFDSMTNEEIGKQDDLFKHSAHGADAVNYVRNTDPQKYQEIKNKMKSGTSSLFP